MNDQLERRVRGAHRPAAARPRRAAGADRRARARRGAAAPPAEAGIDRPAHRRRGARLQQPADGGARQPRAAAQARCRTIPPTDRLIDGAMQGAQRGAALTQRLLAFARRQALEPRPVDHRRAGARHGSTCCTARSARPSKWRSTCRPVCRRRWPMPTRSSSRCSISRSMRATPCPTAARSPSRSIVAGDRRRAGSRGGPLCAALSSPTPACGMDGDTLQRAIEPFFSTKEVGKGTGLGLSMIHGLALQLKGALRLLSEPGRGTRAELWLPVADGARGGDGRAEPAGGRRQAKRRRDAAVRRRRLPDQPQHRRRCSRISATP